jgi:hypothetical protein
LVAKGKKFVVKKDREVVAEIIPHAVYEKRNKGLLKALDSAAKGFVYSRMNNPLRRSRANDFLGKWDK